MIPVRLFRLAIAAATLPISAVGAALRTPQVVRSHPRSRELRELVRDGFDLESVRVGHRGMPTVAELVRDGDRRSLQDADRAFTIYALSRMQRRRLIRTPA
jgi:hypothetical protein